MVPYLSSDHKFQVPMVDIAYWNYTMIYYYQWHISMGELEESHDQAQILDDKYERTYFNKVAKNQSYLFQKKTERLKILLKHKAVMQGLVAYYPGIYRVIARERQIPVSSLGNDRESWNYRTTLICNYC